MVNVHLFLSVTERAESLSVGTQPTYYDANALAEKSYPAV